MLALLAKAEYPKAPLDLQLQIGWLALLLLTLLLVWVWTRAESFRRAIFAREDPRLWATFRIGLGLLTFQNYWNLKMHWRMLWTDEGMFTTEEARERLGRSAMSGWTEIDGFFDGWAILKFFWGKFSLLYIDSSPAFVQIHLAILFVLLILFTVGFRTRVTGVLCWLLANSIYGRNSVYLEGHDTVFRCIWFMTIFARTDAAWSVDNWLRCRREARQRAAMGDGGDPAAIPYDWRHLADRAGHWLWGGLWAYLFCVKVEFDPKGVFLIVLAGVVASAVVGWVELQRRRAEAEQGTLDLAAPVRFLRVPAWPRYLFIAQLICIYWATGCWKTGSVWKRGDALYYALNMDHFYRFEGVTQWVSALLATNVFRVMTHVTLWWERLFALVAVGLILKWALDHRDQLWFREQEVWWRKWLGRGALIGAYVVVYRTVMVAYPWCLALQKDGSITPAEPGLANLRIWFLVVIPLMVAGWFLLGWKPLPVWRIVPERFRRDDPEQRFVIDQRFVRNWLFGRRIWLGVGAIFHGILLTTMNIGLFPVIMVWMYLPYFDAKPFLKGFRWLRDRARERGWSRWMAPKLLDEALSERAAVLETPRRSLERDPTGPWWLDPYKLLVGPFKLLTIRSRRALVEVCEGDRDRGGRIPDVLVAALGAAVLGLIVMRGLEAETEEDKDKGSSTTQFVGDRSQQRQDRRAEIKARKAKIDKLGEAAHWWVYSVLAFAAISHFRRRSVHDLIPPAAAEAKDERAQAKATEPEAPEESNDDTKDDEPPEIVEASAPPPLGEPVLIGGTLMRTIVLGFMVYHCAAIGVAFIPRYSVSQAWRGEARKVFKGYTRGINVSQSWKMFSPNPPRSNTFMQTRVIAQDGEAYRVGNDHYTDRPYVFWLNDRSRKMHRRMIGKSKWYLRYWGQYHCRDWAIKHDGQLPKEIMIVKLRTKIPKPEELQGRPSNPRQRNVRRQLKETHTCKERVLFPELKRRYGWPLTDADERRIEREKTQAEVEAKTKRKNWAEREDYGGTPKDERAKAGGS